MVLRFLWSLQTTLCTRIPPISRLDKIFNRVITQGRKELKRRQRRLIISTMIQSLGEGNKISKPHSVSQNPESLLEAICPRGLPCLVLVTMMNACWKVLKGRGIFWQFSPENQKILSSLCGVMSSKGSPRGRIQPLCNTTKPRWCQTRRWESSLAESDGEGGDYLLMGQGVALTEPGVGLRKQQQLFPDLGEG